MATVYKPDIHSAGTYVLCFFDVFSFSGTLLCITFCFPFSPPFHHFSNGPSLKDSSSYITHYLVSHFISSIYHTSSCCEHVQAKQVKEYQYRVFCATKTPPPPPSALTLIAELRRPKAARRSPIPV